MVENLFLVIVKMSATASIAAIIVILLRQLAGRKLPRIFSYAAWAIVLIRLLVPFSIQSGFSLFNIVKSPAAAIDRAIVTAEPGDASTPHEPGDVSTPNVMAVNEDRNKASDTTNSETNLINLNTNKDTQLKDIEYETYRNETNNNSKGDINAEANIHTDEVNLPARASWISVIAYIWLSVTLVLLGLGIYAYARTTARFRTDVLFDDNELLGECCKKLNLKRKVGIYVADTVDTPVVAGLARARIILPAFLVQKCNNMDMKHVIIHELIHIKRFDYITKLLALLALCIHWFNPLMWISFILSQKDMEISCDAMVLSAYKNDIRSEYARSLLNIATRQHALLYGGMLAFGEKNIRSRIKGIMKFKRSRIWLGVVAALILTVFGCTLLTNGRDDNTGKNKPAVSDNKLSSLLEHKARYIGDAVNVGNLLDLLPYGKNKQGIELATDSQPYGITINYMLEGIEVSGDDTIKSVKSVLQDNSLILFSLIENVDMVKFTILPVNAEVQFERSEMQRHFERQLWEYSNDKQSFEEFLLDIYFKIYIYPEEYSMSMSSVPGMRVVVSLNAAFYDATCSKRCSTENGTLLTRDSNTGTVTDHGKSMNSALGEPVYWSPVDMEEAVGEDTMTISILDTDGDVIAEKRITIEKVDADTYGVRPSYDIFTGSYRVAEYGDTVNGGAVDGDIIDKNLNNDNITNESATSGNTANGNETGGSSAEGNEGVNKLEEHIASMEELLDSVNFQYMIGEQMEAFLASLPEIIRNNYSGIGRLESNGSGYILLTCKSGAKRLPEDTISCGFSPADSDLEQLVLQDTDENEICRFPLGLDVSYYKKDDIFHITVGDASVNTSMIKQIASYQFSGNKDFLEYAKQAKMRGTSLFIPHNGSYIFADIWLEGSRFNEYISIDESFAAEIDSRLASIEKTHRDFSSGTVKDMGVHIILDDRNNYSLSILDDGTRAFHRWSDRNAVLIDPETYGMIADFVMERTPWEWVELSEIHDIVRAEIRMKLYRNSPEEVQVVEDRDSLKELVELLSNAELTGYGGCPYTALLLLTREDGRTITLHIATDSCDSMILGSSAGYDYGPDPGQRGLGGTVNRQDVLKRIFNRVTWGS
jgi:beta-lactamase regulating signal transducer with metallopeptidase domain